MKRSPEEPRAVRACHGPCRPTGTGRRTALDVRPRSLNPGVAAGVAGLPGWAVPPSAAPQPVTSSDRPRRTVLLAEDNRTNQLVVESLLSKLDYRCITVTDGLQAVERVRQGGVDCVLMDLMMPEIDGLAAAREIRKLPGAVSGVPISRSPPTCSRPTSPWRGPRAWTNLRPSPSITRDKLARSSPARWPAGRRRASIRDALTIVAERPPVFDKSALKAIMSELDADSIAFIFETFLQDTSERLELISSPDTDAVTARREAHALKSAAATFGFKRLAHLAAELEEDATSSRQARCATSRRDAHRVPGWQGGTAAGPTRPEVSTGRRVQSCRQGGLEPCLSFSVSSLILLTSSFSESRPVMTSMSSLQEIRD